MIQHRAARAAAAGLALTFALFLGACATQGPSRSDALFAQVKNGMSQEQVQQLLGPPDEKMPFRATRTEGWAYFYYDTWGFYSEYSVTFNDQGKVISTFSKRVGYGGGSGKT
ncbi:MAG TPA: outer membrane protein assembly factor BamE [Usitatibacter sp.]|nr:outer membrane protein assembly factor BamE [Usitatibacter sp.]